MLYIYALMISGIKTAAGDCSVGENIYWASTVGIL